MKIAVIGAGNMGRWFVDRLKKNHHIAVLDRDKKRIKNLTGVSRLIRTAELRDFQPDLLINAVSIQNTVAVFEQCTSFLQKGCIVADIMSVKGKIYEFYKNSGFKFVSIHPMFGPTFTKIDDLGEENVVFIQESCFEGILFFRKFFEDLGARIFECSFEEHDRLIAYSLTLPFTSSLVFAANINSSVVPGTTFKKHLEIARGLLSENDDLLIEILFNPYSAFQLEEVTNKLEFLKHVIKQHDTEEAKLFFDNLRKNI